MFEGIDWTPVVQSLAATNWTAVLVALISGIAAVIGPFCLWKKQGRKESASVRASLFAEVGALVEIVDRLGFLPALREIEALLFARQSSPMQVFQGDQGNESCEVFSDSPFNRLYQEKLSKLGVLTVEEARQIVRFHQLADSVRLDVIPGGGLARGTSNSEAFRETADLLEAAMEIGRVLTAPESEPSHEWWKFWEVKK